MDEPTTWEGSAVLSMAFAYPELPLIQPLVVVHGNAVTGGGNAEFVIHMLEVLFGKHSNSIEHFSPDDQVGTSRCIVGQRILERLIAEVRVTHNSQHALAELCWSGILGQEDDRFSSPISTRGPVDS